MSAMLSPVSENANSRTEQVCGKLQYAVRALGAVMRTLHDLFPKKFAANVAARAGVSTRAVEYWDAKNENRRDMGAPAFISLLQSDAGGEVLEALMLELPPKLRPAWWKRQSAAARIAAIEAAQNSHAEELRQLRLEISSK